MDKPMSVTQAVLTRIVFIVCGLVLVAQGRRLNEPVYYLVAFGLLSVGLVPTRALTRKL